MNTLDWADCLLSRLSARRVITVFAEECDNCNSVVRTRKVTVNLRRGERLGELAKHGVNGGRRLSVPTVDLAGVLS